MYLVLSMVKVRMLFSQYFAGEKFIPCSVFERITKLSAKSKESMGVPPYKTDECDQRN